MIVCMIVVQYLAAPFDEPYLIGLIVVLPSTALSAISHYLIEPPFLALRMRYVRLSASSGENGVSARTAQSVCRWYKSRHISFTERLFNVASDEHRSILEIARDVVRLMNYRMDQIQFIEDRPGQVVRHTGDWSKINRVLGWKPLLSWKEGLQRTAAWYGQSRELWSRQLFMRQIPITTASGKIVFH
jgi:hypothetical protein